MSNLLKDASILLTPTAYENGRMNAIKPSKDLYGPELVTNGDFATDSDWTKGTGWSIANGKASRTAQSGSTACDQNISITAGRTYKIVYDLTITAGNFFVRLAGTTNVSGTLRTTSGTYTDYLTAVAGNNKIRLVGGDGSFVGSIDNVSVVEDLSGDFQFERNSAATRVNAQGLVENVQIISSELVSNGNFSQIGTEEVLNGDFSQEGSELVTNGDFSTDSDWIKGTGWTISGGTAIQDGTGSGSSLYQSNIIVVGKTYKITYEIVERTQGGIDVFAGFPNSNVPSNNTIGVHTHYIKAEGNTNLYLLPSNFIGSITNVSVKEVGQNWDLETGWSIGEDKAVVTNAPNLYQRLTQSSLSFTLNSTYKISITCSEHSAGFVYLRKPRGVESDTTLRIDNVGTFVFYVKALSDLDAFALAVGAIGTDLSISNISVKEVGQDWTPSNNWTIDQANSKASADGTSSATLTQPSLVSVSGAKYKIEYTVSDFSAGKFRVYFGGVFTPFATSNGVYSYVIYSTSSDVFTTSITSTFEGSISNVSVKEVTDDTNIPRINYEGFSYQDTLGSEEVVNGDFSVDSNWTKLIGWTISGGSANCALGGTDIFQSKPAGFWNGKTLKVTYTVSNYVQGEVRPAFWNPGITEGTYVSANGTYTEYISPTTDAGQFGFRTNLSNFIGSIDNVSVKEVTGQEVVPDSGCGSWLLEPQSTNLVTYSEDFSQSVWAKGRVLITPNSIKSPDGSINASTLSVTSATGGEEYLRVQSNDSNEATCSFYVKKGNWRYITLRSVNASVFDFDTETFTFIGTNETVSFEKLQNGWYRLKASSPTRFYCSIGFAVNATTPAGGSGVNGTNMYIWGAQLEQQSYATSYIPTNGATNTRLQDIATNSGNSSLINSTEGVLYAEVDFSPQDNRTLSIKSNTSDRVQFLSKPNNGIRFFISDSGGLKYNDYSNTLVDGFNKIALSWDVNGFYGFVNGSKVHNVSTAINLQGLNQASFESGLDDFFGENKALAVYKTALTDANLRCLTYPNPVATTFDLDFDTIAEQFTFTRGSEATFVNAQGLIESTNTLTSNLVINEESLPLAGWSRDGDVYTAVNATSNVALNYTSGFNFSIGDLVEVSYEVFDYASGNTRVQLSGGGSATYTAIVSSNGVFTETLLLTGNNTAGAILSNSTNPTLKIRNVSIKKIITATNTPRIDYSTGAEAFLLEPQRTNRYLNSEDGSSWTLNNTTLSSLSGGLNGEYYEITSLGATNNFSVVQSNWINTTAATYTASILAKKGTSDELIMTTRANFGFQNNYSAFDLTNGLVTANSSGVVGSIEPYSDGWYRCSITFTNSGGFSDSASLAFGFNFNSSNTDTLFVACPQSEIGSYPTSYIPTSGASATRNQELCNNATPVINSEEGTLYIDVAYLNDTGTYRTISINDGTNNNQVAIENRPTSNQIKAFVVVEGVSVMNLTQTLTDVKSFNKMALKWSKDNFSWWVNGVKLHEDTSGDTFSNGTLTKLNFNNGIQNFPFEGNTKGLKVYPKALADVQLEDLTTI